MAEPNNRSESTSARSTVVGMVVMVVSFVSVSWDT